MALHNNDIAFRILRICPWLYLDYVVVATSTNRGVYRFVGFARTDDLYIRCFFRADDKATFRKFTRHKPRTAVTKLVGVTIAAPPVQVALNVRKIVRKQFLPGRESAGDARHARLGTRNRIPSACNLRRFMGDTIHRQGNARSDANRGRSDDSPSCWCLDRADIDRRADLARIAVEVNHAEIVWDPSDSRKSRIRAAIQCIGTDNRREVPFRRREVLIDADKILAACTVRLQLKGTAADIVC